MRDAPPGNTAVLLTPPQPGAIATIRLNGPLVNAFAARHLSKQPKLNRCVHCDLKNAEELIDDPVTVLVREDCLELHVHGGPWIVESALELTRRFGFKVCRWNDADSADLFDTNDAVTREMLAILHRAETREALAILLAQPAAWTAMIERGNPIEISHAIEDRSLDALLNPPTVAIVGPPNVGKSTLANQLFARSHSITADLPGTTRDWVGERANIDGLLVTLIDTPGQRETSDPIEAAAIESATRFIKSADLVLVVNDATCPRDEAPAIEARHPNTIDVMNKCDIANRSFEAGLLSISAHTGDGMPDLRRAITRRFGCGDLTSLHARCWTDAQRHRLAGLIDSPACR